MFPYIVVFFSALGVLVFSSQISANRKPSKTAFVFSGLLVSALLGLREGVGTDFYSIYVPEFQTIQSGQSSRFEVGFVWLVKFLSIWNSSYNFVFFGVACLTVLLVYRAIWAVSLNPAFSVFVYLVGGTYFFSTNGVRQALAVAVLLNAIPLLDRGKTPQYLICVLIASLFHTSALVFVLIALVRYIKISRSGMFVLLLVGVTLAGSITSFALEHAGVLSDQLGLYSSNDTFTGAGDFDISNLVLCLVPTIGYFMLGRSVADDSQRETISILATIVSLGVLTSLLSGSVAIFSRITYYFVPFSILLVPNLVVSSNLQTRSRRFAFGYIILLLTSSVYLYGYLNFSSVNPYMSVLRF